LIERETDQADYTIARRHLTEVLDLEEVMEGSLNPKAMYLRKVRLYVQQSRETFGRDRVEAELAAHERLVQVYLREAALLGVRVPHQLLITDYFEYKQDDRAAG